MTNKGLIVATVIGSSAYLAGKLIGAKAAEKSATKTRESIEAVYDKCIGWANKYLDKLGMMMSE